MNAIIELILEGLTWILEAFWIRSTDSKLVMLLKSSLIFAVVCIVAYFLDVL